MEIKEEKFSLIKFFAGFGNIGKILFYFALFMAFTVIKDNLAPRIGELIENQKIETYIEAPENKAVYFFGIRISKMGFGLTYEK